MQFGHLGIALAIASLDPRPETFLVVGAAQFLPNADSLIIRAGWARPDFHGTWSHSLLFSSAVGALAVALFGPWLGGLALASIVAHVLADLPTDTVSRCCCRSAGGAFRSTSGRTRDTGGARCTSATTGSRGRGSSRARCSPWWHGATRGSW